MRITAAFSVRSAMIWNSNSAPTSATALRISDRVGTVEPRKTADLFLLDGDPLADIEVLGDVDRVMKEGRTVYVKPAEPAGSSR